jgi:aminoglycoside phosphotransferase (APT) family kinase protein
MQPLAGGVSSDIWRVELPSGPVCVKRALARLKVAALWEAPVSRNAYEVAWMQTVAAFAPQHVPKVIAHDAQSGLFAMEYLDPATHPLWKNELREGRADVQFAARVGAALANIHARTAGDVQVRARFATDDIFYSIRLEPYLVATAGKHPDCAAALHALVQETRTTKRALVHGDVSPKNILLSEQGPIFLDAECAWYGDPAFDLAFCLNHLLLKCLWHHAKTGEARALHGHHPASPAFLACFDALAQSYRAGVTWEAREAIDARTARLLPGLFLARVDGKSPVEYITDDADKSRVRRVARALLLCPAACLAEVRAAWERELRG